MKKIFRRKLRRYSTLTQLQIPDIQTKAASLAAGLRAFSLRKSSRFHANDQYIWDALLKEAGCLAEALGDLSK